MVLVFVLPISNQVWLSAEKIGNKMRSDLINRIDQIGVYGKRVGGSGIADWTDAFALGADRGYNTYRIDYP